MAKSFRRFQHKMNSDLFYPIEVDVNGKLSDLEDRLRQFVYLSCYGTS